LAKRCGRTGGGMPAVLNAANEVIVDAFLHGKLRFGSIAEMVTETVEALGSFAAAHELDEILTADKTAREYALRLMKG